MADNSAFTFVGRNVTPLLLSALMVLIGFVFTNITDTQSAQDKKLDDIRSELSIIKSDFKIMEIRIVTKDALRAVERRVDMIEMKIDNGSIEE